MIIFGAFLCLWRPRNNPEIHSNKQNNPSAPSPAPILSHSCRFGNPVRWRRGKCTTHRTHSRPSGIISAAGVHAFNSSASKATILSKCGSPQRVPIGDGVSMPPSWKIRSSPRTSPAIAAGQLSFADPGIAQSKSLVGAASLARPDLRAALDDSLGKRYVTALLRLNSGVAANFRE